MGAQGHGGSRRLDVADALGIGLQFGADHLAMIGEGHEFRIEAGASVS